MFWNILESCVHSLLLWTVFFSTLVRCNYMVPGWDFLLSVLFALANQAIYKGTFHPASVGQVLQSVRALRLAQKLHSVHSPTLRQTYWGTKHYPLCLQGSWLQEQSEHTPHSNSGRALFSQCYGCITGFSPVMCVTSVGEATHVDDSLTTS
jgi:hypothetical protein